VNESHDRDKKQAKAKLRCLDNYYLVFILLLTQTSKSVVKGGFAGYRILWASDFIASLLPEDITMQGDQTAFLNFRLQTMGPFGIWI